MKKIYVAILLINLFLVNGFSQDALFVEDFEGSDFPPSGWEVMTSASINESPVPNNLPNFWDNWFKYTADIWGQDTYIHKGLQSAAVGGCASSPDTQYSWLVTDLFSIPETDFVELKYWMWYMSATPNYFTHLYILIQAEDETEWTELEDIYYKETINLWYVEEMSLDLGAYVNKNVKLAFVHNSTYQLALDDIRVVVGDPASVENQTLANQSVRVYPNPATSFVNVSFADIEIQSARVSIYDLMGRQMVEQKVNTSANEIQINCSHLCAGIYVIKVQQGAQVFTKNLVLQ